jgi:CheY-like chemotaxis protein
MSFISKPKTSTQLADPNNVLFGPCGLFCSREAVLIQEKGASGGMGDTQHNEPGDHVLYSWRAYPINIFNLWRNTVERGEKPANELIHPNTFRQAKVDHYLMRAEEFVRMSRFLMANRTLQKVLALDPENRTAKSLEKRIEYSFTLLSFHEAPSGSSTVSSDIAVQRHRRNQLVMVVDQDERALLALTERLRLHGFDVVCAAGYLEAIETLGSFKPIVIVSEVNFENGSVGFDLYLWIRTNSTTSDTPFLFLATKVDRDTLIAGKRLGVDDFILKPLDEDVVTASIMQCLARRKKLNGRQ